VKLEYIAAFHLGLNSQGLILSLIFYIFGYLSICVDSAEYLIFYILHKLLNYLAV
jgi:hypothetical protein